MAEFTKMLLMNKREHDLSLIVEPWGEIYSMPAGATFEVRFEIAGEGTVDLPVIVWTEDSVALYAVVGGEIELFHEGQNVRE